ncbi:MAG TPA: condensation domain-containing protein, partial [Acidobacteriaceae bacterium]|nr:condensation domain-containing protein [Acidobacteriaceae bacterium]
MAAALTALARRHSALRTFFPRDLAPGRAACVRPENIEWPVAEIDTAAANFSLDVSLEQFLAPFTPDSPPLLRGALATIGSREHILILAIDHMNFDGQSSGTLLSDLASYWARNLADTDAAGLPRPLRYEHFVRWQSDWVENMGQEALGYWTSLWGPVGLYPDFPFPDPSDAGASARSHVWQRPVTLDALERVGERLGAGHFTEFMLLATAVLLTAGQQFGISRPGLLFPF